MIITSTIIPTIGRASLERAVTSVLEQNVPSSEFEVIVVNDTGAPLVKARWQDSPQVQVIQTQHRERSVARNTGAALARGLYLHFLDDDDWLAPEAFQHLWGRIQSASGKWVYGITQLVDRQGQDLIQLRHNLAGNSFLQVMAGEWIPLQSSFIERQAFLRSGGFNPLLSGPEDIDLLRRVNLVEDLEEVPFQISNVVMGAYGSTTDYAEHAWQSRWAREIILNQPKGFQRMRSSAEGPVWHGRLFRIYLSSWVWNLGRARLFIAISRLGFSLASLVVGGKYIFYLNFWRAMVRPYESVTFEKGFEAIQAVD